jgi:hypothetical protein
MDPIQHSYGTMGFTPINVEQDIVLDEEPPKPQSYAEELEEREDLARRWITGCENYIRSLTKSMHCSYYADNPAWLSLGDLGGSLKRYAQCWHVG